MSWSPLVTIIVLFGAALGFAAQAGEAIQVQSPAGIKTIQLGSDREESAFYYGTEMELKNAKVDDKLLTEEDLKSLLAKESEEMIVRTIQLTLHRMKRKNIQLVRSQPAVSYTVEAFNLWAWTTDGFIEDCWDCGGSSGIRDRVAQHFGLFKEHLHESRISANPRFTPRRLHRGSGSMVMITFKTTELGTIKIPLWVQLDDTYHPFVVDLAPQSQAFGSSYYGTSQAVQIRSLISLDITDKENEQKVLSLFDNPGRMIFVTTSRIGVVKKPVDEQLPGFFVPVKNEGQVDQSGYFHVWRAMWALEEFIKLSDSHISIPTR